MRFRIMTEKDGVWVNGRIEWTKKDACLRNGRLGFGQKNKQTKNFSTLSSSLTQFTIMTKKDGVWGNGRIESRHIKVGLKQTVE